MQVLLSCRFAEAIKQMDREFFDSNQLLPMSERILHSHAMVICDGFLPPAI
jgi:hypothetical protein